MRPIRVCVWATNFQANMYAMTRALARREDFEVLLVTPEAATLPEEPLQRLRPLPCRALDLEDRGTLGAVRAFAPDLTLIDNHYPPERLSPYLLNVWHGFGWRGPEDRKAFVRVYKDIKRTTGGRPDAPNPYFRWNCAGPTNRVYREQVTGFAAENLWSFGQPYYDELVSSDLTRAQMLSAYPASFAGRKIALLGFTWHFGRVFSHWGDDLEIFGRLLAHMDRLGVAAILRMHDRKRFEPAYLSALEALAARHDNVLLKFKDTERDNLLDLLVSDLMISNFSSFLTFFYPSLRPSLHVYPVDPRAAKQVYRVWRRGKVREVRCSPDHIWSLDPEEHGGLVSQSADELLAQVEQAVRAPSCCAAASRTFIATHLAPPDGRTCERIAEAIRAWISAAP